MSQSETARQQEVSEKGVVPDTTSRVYPVEKEGSIPSDGAKDVARDVDSVDKQEDRRWFHWHEPGTSAEEKRLIFKLDWFILSFSCLCFFMKQLDANNVSNAYVSGMQEELGFGPGNELSWMNTYFNIGQILGGTFANMIITVIRPRYWLSGCLMIWSLFVLFLYKCETATQFYALRFCIGLFESAAWPGVQYVLGCWYRKSELARRSAFFVMSGVLGQMFSGYLQAALFAGMDGKGGMSAWRWLFIFDFILGVPVAIYGLVRTYLFLRKKTVFAIHLLISRFRSAILIPLSKPKLGISMSGNASELQSASRKRDELRWVRWT
jgi:MFS transporter, ACS family, pantothenate transporter